MADKAGGVSSTSSLWSFERLALTPRSPAPGSPAHSPTAEADSSTVLPRRSGSPLRRHQNQATEFQDTADAEDTGGGVWSKREPLSVRSDFDADADHDAEPEWAPGPAPAAGPGQARASVPGRVLVRSIPLGPRLARLVQRPWLAFAAAQVLIIWLTATAVVFVHDYAARVSETPCVQQVYPS